MLNTPDPETQRSLQAAVQALASGDRAAAQAHARAVLLRRPSDPTANQILGVIALEAGDFTAARRRCEALVAIAPSAAAFNLLGVALRGLEDMPGARATFTRAGELGSIDAWRNLASIEARHGKVGDAIVAYERALAISPYDPAAHAGLAELHERRHDLVSARAHVEAALQRDPAHSGAQLTLARVLLREGEFPGAEKAAMALANAPQASPQQHISALGLVGDARDRRGDFRGAFQAFTAANQASLRLHGAWLSATDRLYHPDNVRRMVEYVAATDVSIWRASRSFATPAPTFLVGFPRSGTTLLDQILSSHSKVVCLEEKQHFSDAVSEVCGAGARPWDMAPLSAGEIASIRESYWLRVGSAANEVVIDKLPLNVVVLPLIKAIFPDASIVFAARDPRDVILSCYQQRFGMNAAMAQFLELGSAAAYYDLMMSLYELCRERLELKLHQVRYEDVVADLEQAARGLCAFLGLSYEPSMLDFRATALARTIETPSSRQVTEPLYARSVGRWRHYQTELAPVLPQLNVWVKRFGYAV